MKILEKIDKFLIGEEGTTTGDVENNTAKGSVDLIGPQDNEDDCPEGYQWCPKTKKCVPIGSGDGDGPRRRRK